MRSPSPGFAHSARMACSAPVRSATTARLPAGRKAPVAGLGMVTTGVPQAVISKIRRAIIDGLVTTELTLRKTRWAR